MKIKDYALQKGVSEGTVYYKIKKSKYDRKQITSGNGNITKSGLAILDTLFPEPVFLQVQPDPEELQKKLEEAERDFYTAQADRARLKEQLEQAKERADKWERLYLELQDRAAQEREQHAERERETKLLLAQQMETNRYLSMNPIKRLFSGRWKK